MSASGCKRAKASSDAGSRAVATTWSPCSRAASQIAFPRPRDAPVTNQTLFVFGAMTLACSAAGDRKRLEPAWSEAGQERMFGGSMLGSMRRQRELGAFLRARRDGLEPEDLGLPARSA